MNIETKRGQWAFAGRLFKKLNGYIFIKVGEEWIAEHRLVCEQVLNRQLTKKEVIHHRDLNKTNNKPSNLALFENQPAHMHFHKQLIQFGFTNHLKRELDKRMILNLAKEKQ